MTVRRRVATLTAVSVVTLSGAARADGPSDLEAALAEPVVTTASQTAEDQSAAPATSTTITAEDLRRYGIKTLAEAINFLSLGMVTQNNLDDGEIGARGVLLSSDYGDHVLLLVNGHAMNEPWDGTSYYARGAGIPFELIDHIEVILGPGSVLYGSQAMLGVINIVTKRAKDFDGFHFVGEGDLLTSGRGAVGFGREFTFLGKRAELTYELEYYAQSGPAFVMGPQTIGLDTGTGKGACLDPTCSHPGIWGGYPARDTNWVKLPDGYLRLIWGDFELDARAESYQRNNPAMSFTGYNTGTEFETDRFVSGDLRHRWAISPLATLKSRLYADAYTYFGHQPTFWSYQCYYPQISCIYQGNGDSRWVGLEEQLSLDWLHDQSLTTLLGVDGRAAHVGESNVSTAIATDATPLPAIGVFDKAEYRVAVYGQQTWRPIKWLSLNAGARADADMRPEDNQTYGRVSPRGVVAVTPWHNGTLKAIYSEAFRAPSYFETSFTDGQTSIPNFSLQPEVVRSGEVSFEQRLGTQRFFAGGFLARYTDVVLSQNAPAAALQNAVANKILPVPPGGNTLKNDVKTYGVNGYGTAQSQNLSSVDDIGVNAAFEGTALDKDLRYGINFTYALAEQALPNPNAPATTCPYQGTPTTPSAASCNYPLTVAPRAFGNARISYDLPGDWPVLAVVASLVGRRPAANAFTSSWQTPPYAPTQLELRGTISGRMPGIVGLSYRLIASYAVAALNPYVVGPDSTPTRANPVPELIPVDQLRTTVGLQYDLK